MEDLTAKTSSNRFAFECDDLDAEVIHRAISIRQRSVMPDHGSDTTGAVIAEICRGWLDSIGGMECRSDLACTDTGLHFATSGTQTTLIVVSVGRKIRGSGWSSFGGLRGE